MIHFIGADVQAACNVTFVCQCLSVPVSTNFCFIWVLFAQLERLSKNSKISDASQKLVLLPLYAETTDIIRSFTFQLFESAFAAFCSVQRRFSEAFYRRHSLTLTRPKVCSCLLKPVEWSICVRSSLSISRIVISVIIGVVPHYTLTQLFSI